MAGELAQPTLSDIEFTAITSGALRVDIDWDGQANSIDAVQLRTRWIAHGDGRSSDPPTVAAAGSWAESTALANPPGADDFEYIDTIEQLTSAQMDTSGTVSEENEVVVNAFFANKTVWAMSRLEVA